MDKEQAREQLESILGWDEVVNGIVVSILDGLPEPLHVGRVAVDGRDLAFVLHLDGVDFIWIRTPAPDGVRHVRHLPRGPLYGIELEIHYEGGRSGRTLGGEYWLAGASIKHEALGDDVVTLPVRNEQPREDLTRLLSEVLQPWARKVTAA